MGFIRFIVLVLMIAGAINWGFVGFFQYDFIKDLTQTSTQLARLIYCIVGVAGLYGISFLFCKSLYCCHKKEEK